MTADSAVDWYRGLNVGSARTPVPARTDEQSNLDGTDFETSSLTDDPIWPHLGLPIGETIFAQPTGRENPAPFMGSVAARIHRRFGSDTDFDSVLADDAAILFVARRLHLNLREYPEYLGSVALIVPDPILERVENFLIAATQTDAEKIFYRFVPRRGADLMGLRLTNFDEEAHLLTAFESREVPADGIIVINKAGVGGRYGYVVTHVDHGALLYSPPTPFLRTMTMNMSVSSRPGSVIELPLGDARDSHRIKYITPAKTSSVGTSVFGDAASLKTVGGRVSVAAANRLRAAQAGAAGQRWFGNGSREQAVRFIQGLITNARNRVVVADPYFGSIQVLQFLYAAGADDLRVTLLTSSLAFKGNQDRSRGQIASEFKAHLEKIQTDVRVSPEVLVLNPTDLHDRFLVIDDAVWFLGNSLNSLGEKSSLIVKVPDPASVIDRLLAMSLQATRFQDYVQSLHDDAPESEE